MNQLLSSLQSIRYAYPSVNILKKDLEIDNETNNDDRNKNINFKNNIIIRDLNFIIPILTGHPKFINLKIKVNETIGIIGESGAGKSTLIDIILGLLKPSSGSILTDDINIFENIKSWQAKIGYVPQEITLFDDTIRKYCLWSQRL